VGLNDGQLDTELSKAAFEAQGIDVYSLVYPYGSHDATVRAAAKRNKYYSAYEAGSDSANTKSYVLTNHYNLRRRQMEFDGGAPALTTVAATKTAIDNAVLNGDWLTLYNHDIPKVGGFPSTNDFAEVVRYALKKHIAILTCREATMYASRIIGSVWINPRMFDPGTASLTRVNDFQVIDLPDTGTTSIYTTFFMPYDYLYGTPYVIRIYYIMASATSGGVRWQTFRTRLKEGDMIAETPTGVGGTATVPGTAGQVGIMDYGGALSDFDVDEQAVGIRIVRLGSDGDDTATGDARFLGCEFRYLKKWV